jgi:hypothetical protein
MIFSLVFVTSLLIVSIILNVRFFSKLESVIESIESSLDVIDDSYRRVHKYTTHDVLSSEPIVVSLVNDIKVVRDSLLLTANILAEPFNPKDENEVDSDD